MIFDFSSLKTIDFQNTNNIIFLFVVLVLVLVLCTMTLFILASIIKGIKRFFSRIFGQRKNVQPANQQSETIVREKLNVDQTVEIPKEKKMAGDFMIAPSSKDEKNETKSQEIKMGNQPQKKEDKEIAAGLNKLKANNPNNPDKKNTLQSKMPSRDAVAQAEDDNQPIKIPRIKKEGVAEDEKPLSTEEAGVLAPETKDMDRGQLIQIPRPQRIQGAGVASGIGSVSSVQNGAVTKSQPLESAPLTQSPSFAGKKPAFTKDQYGVHSAHENIDVKNLEPGKSFFEKPGFMENKYGINVAKEKEKPVETKDASIFGGKEDLSRREMSDKLRNIQKQDKYMKIERDLGLSMSRQQMGDLVQKYFPKIYGSNISKEEFRKQIRKLEKTPIHDPGKRIQTRREISLLKKIGGIK